MPQADILHRAVVGCGFIAASLSYTPHPQLLYYATIGYVDTIGTITPESSTTILHSCRSQIYRLVAQPALAHLSPLHPRFLHIPPRRVLIFTYLAFSRLPTVKSPIHLRLVRERHQRTWRVSRHQVQLSRCGGAGSSGRSGRCLLLSGSRPRVCRRFA